LRERKSNKMQGNSVFCSESFSDPYRKVRSKLQWGETGYEAGP